MIASPLLRQSALTVSGLLLWASVAAAQPAVQGPDPRGEPRQFHGGKSACYAVWHGPLGWNLRTTAAGQRRNFRGEIQVVDGTFIEANGVRLEKIGPLHDRWHLSSDRHTITFNFHTDEGVDGLHFCVSKGASILVFQLFIDDAAMPDRIFVGHQGNHPASHSFFFPAHP